MKKFDVENKISQNFGNERYTVRESDLTKN